MTLKERFNAESSALGKILSNWVGRLLLLFSAIGAANEYLSLIPPDFVPQWLKAVIVISGVISFVAGRLTVKKDTNLI